MRDSFSTYHPLVNFCYFSVIIVLAMTIMHPLYLFIALLSQSSYAFLISGRRFLHQFKFFLPLIVIAVLINACFNHQGATILAYFPSGNPLTYESICYALAAALALANVLISFFCFSQVIDSEKFIYLFGRILPALALIISMTLRFIPKFKQQLHHIRQNRQTFGADISQGTMWQKLCHALHIFSILLSWTLENALITADSMKSRGYGTAKRTAFSLYRFEKRDYLLLIIILGMTCFFINSLYGGVLSWRYFPLISALNITPLTAITLILYAIFSFIPIICHVWQHKSTPISPIAPKEVA